MLIKFINKLNNKPNGPIYFKYKKQIFIFLNILKKYNYINFEIIQINKNYFKINILKNNLQYLKTFKKNKNTSYKLLQHTLYSYILSTNKGLLLHQDALNAKVGGFIICKFY
jgi:ribosomal protein S8